ncbi:S-adenosyl-L-methionine-dependent methyltransferase [Jimgerdemannia flammicorona]|uniref:S-adenosyl-L-methionine-dependent methyltransferase n=1 Tax=Jimgerdemannia flammicorona TaxID=994334 RepID=A0A433QU45_9FUNG|nr:S-adenosyl-L-methionine-dependent methyltransferase [Jimgerdemannia flammicorona]
MGNTPSSRLPKKTMARALHHNQRKPHTKHEYEIECGKDSTYKPNNVLPLEPSSHGGKKRYSLLRLHPSSLRPSLSVTSSTGSNQSSTCPSTPSWSGEDPHFLWLQQRRFLASPDSNFSYSLPVDDEEIDRTIVEHFLLKSAFSGNYAAPVDHLLSPPPFTRPCTYHPHVLDVGCGSAGVWLMETATDHPQAKCYGVDIVASFPTTKPPNVHFHTCNVVDGLPFEDATFDFVHMRLMWFSFAADQWNDVLKELNRVLKPGGYLELMDPHPVIYDAGPLTDTLINHQLPHALQSRNIDPIPADSYADVLSETLGLSDVRQHYLSMPHGWGGEIGRLNLNDLVSIMMGFKPWLCTGLSMTSEEYDEQLHAIEKECIEHESFCNWYVAYGMKPIAGEDATVVTAVVVPDAGVMVQEWEDEKGEALWERWQPYVDGFVE